MKISIVTCQNADNYGARLQAFALSDWLARHGHEVEVVDYRPHYMDFRVKLLEWPGGSLRRWAKLILQWRRRARAIRRHAMFSNFSTRHIPLSARCYHSVEALRSDPPKADLYLAGSDQIWNTMFRNGRDAAFYLDFGLPETQRVSYAASFATRAIAPGWAGFVKERLGRFDRISVREASGVRLLHALGFEGCEVADPAFLLSAADWDRLAEPGGAAGCILVYDVLGSRDLRHVAERLARLWHCRVVVLGAETRHYRGTRLPYVSPERFVGLMREARCVVSNSYHATVFSMIYERDFLVVPREDGLNDRMTDLLDSLGLGLRMVSPDSADELLTDAVDYTRVRAVLHEWRAESERFLENVTR